MLHDIRFYKDPNGVQPAKEFLKDLQNQGGKNARIQAKQIAAYITLLQEKDFPSAGILLIKSMKSTTSGNYVLGAIEYSLWRG